MISSTGVFLLCLPNLIRVGYGVSERQEIWVIGIQWTFAVLKKRVVRSLAMLDELVLELEPLTSDWNSPWRLTILASEASSFSFSLPNFVFELSEMSVFESFPVVA